LSVHRAAALGFVLAVALAGGCGLLVPNNLSEVHCVDEGVIGPPACPEGMFCSAGLCRDGPPRAGEACSEGGRCGPGDLCVAAERLGLEGDDFCSHPCCSSHDCGFATGLVCAVVGPGKMCVPGEKLGRVALGARSGGEGCEHDGDCRSGVCSTKGGFCVDACCSDVACGVFDGVCRMEGGGWTCRPETGVKKGYSEKCEGDDECASGLCTEWGDALMRCAEPCCSSVECGSLMRGEVPTNVLCVPRRRGVSMVYACAAFAEGDADRAIGEPCDDDGQCRGGRCVEAAAAPDDTRNAKVCTDVCCTDASCGAPGVFACVPLAGEADASPPDGDEQGFGLQCTRVPSP